MPRWHGVFLLVLLCCLPYGCVEQNQNRARVITSGYHIPVSDEQWEKQGNQDAKRRFVVWGNHVGATQAAVTFLQQGGQTVVERARLMEVFEEQRIQLTHSPDDDARILKVGKLVGAERVLFVEVSDRGEVESGVFVGPYGGASRSNTVHHVSVSVRSVNLETGVIRWSGHATLDRPITDPESTIHTLTTISIMRATCLVERGRVWTEQGPSPADKWGCLDQGGRNRSMDK